MRIILSLLLLVLSPSISADEIKTSVEQPGPIFRFALPPQQSPRELAKRWGPVIRYISEHSGVSLQFQTAHSYADYQQEMKAGRYDVSIISSYFYAQVDRDVGYTALVREKDANFEGIMVVRKDSPHKTMADLKGAQVAYPGPTAVTSMLAHTYLKANNIDYTPKYVVSFDSVYLSVAKGLFAAGQGERRTFGNIDPAIRDQLRILWSADPLPPFAVIAHARVPQAAQKKIQQVLQAMGDTKEGIELLRAINMKGFVASKASDYDEVRKLSLLTPDPSPQL